MNLPETRTGFGPASVMDFFGKNQQLTIQDANCFSLLGKLADRAIYFACANFFFFFKWRKIISGSTGPIFF